MIFRECELDFDVFSTLNAVEVSPVTDVIADDLPPTVFNGHLSKILMQYQKIRTLFLLTNKYISDNFYADVIT